MAHFIGTVRGRASSQASRLGTKSTGITATARGWNIGGTVSVQHFSGRDVVEFCLTGGSNGSGGGQIIARYALNEDGTITKLGG